jgi:hypothetical protein
MPQDPTFVALEQEVRRGEDAIVREAECRPGAFQEPRRLRDRARGLDITAGAIGLAMDHLIEAGRLRTNADLQVAFYG